MANRVLLGNVKGETGATGAAGATGASGANGLTPYIQNGTWWLGTQDTGVTAEGNKWFANNYNPSTEGSNGDLYLNTLTGDVFKKENNVWDLVANIKGEKGDTGAKGDKGDSALSIKVGETITAEAGENAYVENVGTETDLVLNFRIPKGDKGEKGDKGDKGEDGSGFIEAPIDGNMYVRKDAAWEALMSLTQEELETIMNGVFYPAPDAYTLKIYNAENVTSNYNSAWEGYAYIEMGEFPQRLVTADEPIDSVETTGKTFTFGGNTFEIWKSELDETRRYAKVNGGSEFYKFEPLRWLVLATSSDLTDTATYGLGANNHSDMPESGQKLLVLSEFALYRDYFDKETPYTNKFSSDDCDLRVNMNGGFAEMSGLAKYFGNYIPATEYGTTWNDGTAEQFDVSSSNIFALGRTNGSDANVDTFHILSYMASGSEQMQAIPTEFAVNTGASLNTTYNASFWWLRSGQSGVYNSVYNVGSGGSGGNGSVNNNSFGVRPSFILNLGGENE
jgi:hypothetical protein